MVAAAGVALFTFANFEKSATKANLRVTDANLGNLMNTLKASYYCSLGGKLPLFAAV
jgi:hypothetical protein